MVPEGHDEVRLGRLLSTVGGIAAVLTLVGLVAPIFRPELALAVASPGLAGAVSGIGLIAALAWFGAADVRRFRPLIVLLVAALAFEAVFLVALAVTATGSSSLAEPLVEAVLFAIAAIAIGAPLIQTKPHAPVLPWPTEKPITEIERVGQIVIGVLGICSLAFGAWLLALGLGGAGAGFFTRPLLATGPTVEFVVLGTLALLAVSDVRKNAAVRSLLTFGFAIGFLAALTTLGSARGSAAVLNLGGGPISLAQLQLDFLWANLVLFLGVNVLSWTMDRAQLDYLGYLMPFEFRAVEALADCLVQSAPAPAPAWSAALTLDRYLSSFPSSRLVLTRLAITGLELAPIAWLQAPLSILSPMARRRFLDLRFKQDISAKEGRVPILDALRNQLQGAIRIGMQAAYIGCYSDAGIQRAIGYTPFSQRFADFQKIQKRRPYPALTVTTPNEVARMGLDVITDADVVVIGSGAAGSILAEQLLAQGREVLMLEKGLFVDPDDFQEDEVHQISHLYADGALQVSQSYRFQVLQANCVGGGTVVNNAVCFDTPERVLQSWNDPLGHNAGIDEAEFRRSQQAVKDRLQIQSIKMSTTTRRWQDVLNPGDRVIAQGVAAMGLQPGDEFDVVRANITDCLGCGYCNIGCKFGRKLSMLDEVLPRAQRDHGPEHFRIFSEAQAIKLKGSGRRVKEIDVRLRDGRQLLIRNPKTVVVSAATIASSWLLMNSGIGQGELPVGRNVCFNFGSPLHGYWPSTNGSHLDSIAGLQIAHYLEFAARPGFVVESWYNPPVAQAMAMPGWLDQHERNMRHYRDFSAIGVLVGSETNAYVTPALLLRGTPDIVYRPTDHDLETLVGALITLGEIMFAGGAAEVLPSTMSYKKAADTIFTRSSDLQRLHQIVRDDRDLVLGTGHPQGGNAISKTRGQNRGVIDPELKVYGYDNLFVCDGSVHPSPTTVNPQLSIMTFAHYAAKFVAQAK
jgi:choline dehydrogenase-like flavoprotein